jgi:3-dehydroquinate synthase class II
MQKIQKIVELKIEETKAVVGGIKVEAPPVIVVRAAASAL